MRPQRGGSLTPIRGVQSPWRRFGWTRNDRYRRVRRARFNILPLRTTSAVRYGHEHTISLQRGHMCMALIDQKQSCISVAGFINATTSRPAPQHLKMLSKKILVVFGATGNQGGSVIKTILNDPVAAARFDIRAITRDPLKFSAVALVERGVAVVKVRGSHHCYSKSRTYVRRRISMTRILCA
jgi:hypothetical protein